MLHGLDGLFLEYDGGGEIFHQLLQLDHGAFDFLDVVVAGADGAEDGAGGGGGLRKAPQFRITEGSMG